MIRTIIFTLAMLLSPHPVKDAAQQDALRLEPDYETLWLDSSGPRTFEPCNPWPIRTHQPRAFNMRGKIINSGGDEVGRYFVRGVIRQSDGAHVADYALTLRSIGTIVFSLDALPEVGPYEFDGFVFSGQRRNEAYELVLTPRLTTDCIWGMRWNFTLNFQQEGIRQ